MDEQQRIDLDKLIREYNSEDTTSKIRTLKHSSKINNDVYTIEKLKKEYSRLRHTNKEQFKSIAQKRANFLFNNYTNIFNRLINDELDLNVLAKFLSVLKQIEDGAIDQHEGSYIIGSLLKELYIDSALRRDKKINDKKPSYKKIVNNISWDEYKNMNNE